MKNISIYTILICMIQICMANPPDSLCFKHIGNSLLHGKYSNQNGIHRLSGAGSDIWNKRDNFDFASVRLSGDLQIIARVLSVEHIDNLTKAGIMIRNSVSAESVFAFMFYSQKKLGFDYRTLQRYSCRNNDISTVIKLPYWLKLIRKGDMFISQRSADGKNWHTVEIKKLDMADTVYYGLAVVSHDTSKIARAEFDHVHIEKFDSPLSHEMQNAIIRSHILYSKYVKDSFEIFIGLPLNYDSTKAKIYPVAYHLDGGDVNDHHVIRNFMTDKLVPEVITVGIGYPRNLDQRERDYRNGFEKFYMFMKNELIPFIDEHYKTNPVNRTLYGYSYGGLCCLQTLYKYADDGKDMPFQGIIAGSPTIWWRFGNGAFNYRHENELFNQTKILPVNFYMCMGSNEGRSMVPHFKKMTKILESRNYQKFNFKHKLNKGLNHASNKRVCYREGYLWLLNQSLP